MDVGFEPDALRERYRVERELRLRGDGNAQYREPEGALSRYRDDPFGEPVPDRARLDENAEVVVVGGGFGGLLMASRLREAGIEDVRIVEKGSDFGGTWYWNRFPGAACDIESYIYLPLLGETGYLPTQKYVTGKEIFAYTRRLARHFDLYRRAYLRTEVTGLRWDDAQARWIVSTDRGDRLRARFVVLAGGPLHRPKLPGVEGIETFAGHSFHTSRWDYGYTGKPDDGMPGLAGKRVGVVGTGATAVQSVPHLGAAAGELFVFQRTPSSVDVRANRPTDPRWADELRPGWQQRRMDNFNALVNGGHVDDDLVDDGWTDGLLNLVVRQARAAHRGDEQVAELVQLADFEKMEKIRARVSATVQDLATAEALKPYYNWFCKRPCFHDSYLDTFNRENVHLVDTRGRGIERVTERGVVADGQEYPLDCLVFATGFEYGTDLTRRIGFDVHGRGGLSLHRKWKDGPETLHGFTTNGFPNLFVMSVVQSGLSQNFTHMLAEQARHLTYVLTECRNRAATAVEVTSEAETEWTEKIIKFGALRRDFLRECTPGYYSSEGEFTRYAAKNASYGAGPVAFANVLRDWRADGTMAGLRLR